MEIDKDELKKIHAMFRPIAEKSPMVDSRAVALLNMRMIEVLLGEYPTTALPTTHHA